MKKNILFISLLLFFLSFAVSKNVSAKPSSTQISTPSQLIAAVNGLRASYGLAPLAEHSILMQSAQSQADYMAATGNITHSRPNGITYTQQLLSLGFPLAGDLSLGGFRAENILSTFGYLEWNGVPNGWEDAAHMNTMLSQNFTHIGAGISQAGGSYYYAVDTAASTANGQMQTTSQDVLQGVSGASGEAAGVSQFMVPITLNTADASGKVFHKVEYGQTLWSIAVAYGTTIKSIQALNGLGEDLTIFQGQNLLVLQNATQSAPSALAVTVAPASTEIVILPTATFPVTDPVTEPSFLQSTPTATATVANIESSNSEGTNSRLLVIILILAAFVGAGMAVWLIRDPQS